MADNGEGPGNFTKFCKARDAFVNGLSLELNIKEKEEKKLIAKISTSFKESFFSQARTTSLEKETKASEFEVRDGLGPVVNDYVNGELISRPSYENINQAESLILQAFSLSEQRGVKINFDLSKIKSATVYELFPESKRDGGGAYLLEAKDEKGEKIGSFVGGSFFGSCKK